MDLQKKKQVRMKNKAQTPNTRSYCIAQFTENMNITLINLIYLYTEEHVILMRYAA